MSSILPFACDHHPIWSPLANEIHAVIGNVVGLEKVREFVREWASDCRAKVDAAESLRQEKFARARQALHYPEDSTLHLIAQNLPDDEQLELKKALWEPEHPGRPLPPSHYERSPAEKWAALAALHDVFDLSGDKVLPWPLPKDDHDLAAFTEWMRGDGGAYLSLMRVARELPDTDADWVCRWLEDVKKIAPTADPAVKGVKTQAKRVTALSMQGKARKEYLACVPYIIQVLKQHHLNDKDEVGNPDALGFREILKQLQKQCPKAKKNHVTKFFKYEFPPKGKLKEWQLYAHAFAGSGNESTLLKWLKRVDKSAVDAIIESAVEADAETPKEPPQTNASKCECGQPLLPGDQLWGECEICRQPEYKPE